VKTPSPQFDFLFRPNRGLRVFLEGLLWSRGWLARSPILLLSALKVLRIRVLRLGLAGLHELLVDNHYVNDESVDITIDLYAKGLGGIWIGGAAAPEAIGFEFVPADIHRALRIRLANVSR
jgi:hypothetical protein